MLDQKNDYKKRTRRIIRDRFAALQKGMGVTLPPNPYRAAYYATLDVLVWARREIGEKFADWLVSNHEPVDIVFRLAEKFSTVLLNGGGFAAPDWSVRVSLANLPDETYAKIGEYLADVMKEYLREWRAAKKEKQA